MSLVLPNFDMKNESQDKNLEIMQTILILTFPAPSFSRYAILIFVFLFWIPHVKYILRSSYTFPEFAHTHVIENKEQND